MAEFYGVQRESARETPTMLRVIRICRKCGARILSDAPEGLCARCMLKIGLGIVPDTSVAGVADAGSVDKLSCGDAPAPEAEKGAGAAELLGQLGDYELLEEVGRGGQGVVTRARQNSPNRTITVTGISIGPWSRKTDLKRFRHDAETAPRLDHPRIVP